MTIFFTLDLVTAYFQLTVHPADVPLTAIITTFGLFKFIPLPFGLRKASITFYKFMNGIVRGLNFVFDYLDPIPIVSESTD